MTFTDLPFFIYLALCLLVFRFIPLRSRWIFLLFSGFVFYMFLDVRFLATLVVMGAATYLGCWLLRHRTENRLAILWTFCLGVCAWLFLIRWPGTNAVAWFGPPFSLHPGAQSEAFIGLTVPVGISFHALQCIAILVDTYRKPAGWDPHAGHMALYLGYMPQILAGPTERAHKMFPQFKAPTQRSSSEALQGLEWFVWGLFKKVVLADRFSVVLAAYVADPSKYPSSTVALFVILMFPAYLYMDFSGYTDMARGMSMWFGIHLSRNFDAPYSSRTTHEFWQRWHMTLHHFIRDYVYVPLRRKIPNAWTCTLIAFAISGLWHGLGFHFFVWAMVSFLIADVEIRLTKRYPLYRSMPGAPIRAYVLTAFTSTFFFVPNVATTFEMYRGVIANAPTQLWPMLTELGWRPLDLFVFVGFTFAYILRDKGSEERAVARPEWMRWAILVAVLLAIFVFRFPKVTLHPYFRF